MNSKILKYLSIILLLFVAFFVKINSVSAEEYTEWSAPIPLITTNGKLVKVTTELRSSFDVYAFSLKIVDETIKDSDGVVSNKVSLFFMTADGGYVRAGAVTSIHSLESHEYVKLVADGNRNIKFLESNEEEFKKQYSIYAPIADNIWEYLLYIYKDQDNDCKSSMYDSNGNLDHIPLLCNNKLHVNFKNYLDTTGGIVFRAHSNNAYYDKNKEKNLYKYYNAILDYKKNRIDNATKDNPAKFSITDLYNSWEVLRKRIQAPSIDANNLEMSSEPDVDTRAFGPEFYKSSIKNLEEYLGDDVKTVIENMKKNLDDNPSNDISNYSNTRRNTKPLTSESITKWFYYAGRYLFDEGKGLDEYKKYYKYLYANQIIAAKKGEGNKEYLAFLEVLENTQDIITTIDSQKKLSDDPCVVYCPMCLAQEVEQTDTTAANDTAVSTTNSQACTQCMQGGTKYRQCKEARDGECHNNCRYISGEVYDKCIDTCLSNKFEDYKETKEKVEKKLDDLKNNRIEKNLKALISLSAPELNIDFNEEGYKINCEDVSFLHNIYLVIVFLAPGLVILLGSIDFAKAVIASDEKKMSEFKKAFPKRIALLVLLIVIPIVIKLLVGGFTDLESTLLDCVVNGS